MSVSGLNSQDHDRLPPVETGIVVPAEASSTAPPGADRVNILLVDDEPKNLTVLETVLDDPEYQLVRAESADAALLALVAREFAVIVLDIHMPGMSGFELAQMIKQRKKTAGVPIIFLTAYYNEDQHVIEGYTTGAVDYLHKPVNATILRSKVAVFADLFRKTRESAIANAGLEAEVTERRRVQEEMRTLNTNLERRVAERTMDLLEANRELQKTEERLRMAQRAGKVGIWDWNLQIGQGTMTEAAWDLLDPTGQRGEFTLAKWLACIHPDDRERAVQAVNDARTSGHYRDEFRIVGNDSEARWIESVGSVEYDDGEPIRMLGAVRDITERKQFELELKENDRRKDQFLAMLGHELRNPLAPIRNAVSILKQIGPDEPDLNWCREVIDRQTEHLTRLVDDLLDVSRVSRGKIQLDKGMFDLAVMVQQAVETCRPLIDSREHQLTVTVPTEPRYIEGDFTRLSQVVANLVNNAAKYTDQGGRIWLTVETESGDASHAVIRVRDNGRGLDAEAIANLFDLFYQVDGNLDRSDGGLGIGLALVKSLVEMHSGTVEARSAGRGHGSEFIVRLPLRSGYDLTAQVQAPVLKKSAAAMKILVVDDNLDAAKSLQMLLEILGHQVLVAHDGINAVKVALEERPQVVLLDIGLPGLNGYQACRSMRQQGMTQEMIAAITGYGQESDRKLAVEAGFDFHLVKPVNSATLQQLLTNSKIRERSASGPSDQVPQETRLPG